MKYKFTDSPIYQRDVYFKEKHRTIHCLMKVKNCTTPSAQIFRKRKGVSDYLCRKISNNQITEAIWY
jgi:hypothetical protein